jgi:hypothetical protein
MTEEVIETDREFDWEEYQKIDQTDYQNCVKVAQADYGTSYRIGNYMLKQDV